MRFTAGVGSPAAVACPLLLGACLVFLFFSIFFRNTTLLLLTNTQLIRSVSAYMLQNEAFWVTSNCNASILLAHSDTEVGRWPSALILSVSLHHIPITM